SICPSTDHTSALAVDFIPCHSITMQDPFAEEARMRYAMFVCVDPSTEPFDQAHDNTEEWISKNDANGRRIIGHRLDHVRTATTVRVRKGQLLVTDGPFAETREHPMARFGRIEIRPLWVRDCAVGSA